MREFDFETIVKNPAVFADGRLPAHSDHVAYRSEAELAAGESSLRLCLDGVWKFHCANNIQAAPEGFWRPDYDIRSWDTIRVDRILPLREGEAPAGGEVPAVRGRHDLRDPRKLSAFHRQRRR